MERGIISVEEFSKAIDEAKTVFITAHVGPDGDTLGSMLAFMHAFEKARKNIIATHCVISGKMPDVYRFLPGIKEVKDCETADDLLEQYDVAISVDCGSPDRLGPAEKHFQNAKTSVNIDHHISNKNFGEINIVEPKASASGEVVADILKTMEIPLDPFISTCLYTALVTDTGGFKYSNTTPKAMELGAQLISIGADPEYIFKQIYEARPVEQAMLQAELVLNTQFNREKSLAWTTVTRELLNKHGAEDEHIDGVVESLRQIDTVVISAVFKETRDGNTKVSLRSDNHAIDVAEVMEQFAGGGHKMAAGCTINCPPEEAHKKLLPILEEKIQAKVTVLH